MGDDRTAHVHLRRSCSLQARRMHPGAAGEGRRSARRGSAHVEAGEGSRPWEDVRGVVVVHTGHQRVGRRSSREAAGCDGGSRHDGGCSREAGHDGRSTHPSVGHRGRRSLHDHGSRESESGSAREDGGSPIGSVQG